MNRVALNKLLFALVVVAMTGCATQPRSKLTKLKPSEVSGFVTTEQWWQATPLTAQQVALLESRLSTGHIQKEADLKELVPKDKLYGLILVPISYAWVSPLDSADRAHPYTQTISVCRLNKEKDLVIEEDDQTGVKIIRKWLIRDYPEP